MFMVYGLLGCDTLS